MPVLQTIIIYAKNVQRSAEFYQKYFGFIGDGQLVDGLIELNAPNQGASILIHQAARTIRTGHAGLKLMFDIEDIEGFKQHSATLGLNFGATHQANGYVFANTKDPDGNSIAISSRNFRTSICLK